MIGSRCLGLLGLHFGLNWILRALRGSGIPNHGRSGLVAAGTVSDTISGLPWECRDSRESQ